MITINMKEMKQIELNILSAFASYCELHHLKYILYAGTLIGAIRHKGFIPWDDDVDVAMPRPDYEKFIKLIKEEPISSHLKLFIYRDINSYYWASVAKLVDDRTEGHEVYQGKGIHNGVWIDIYPIDGMPEDDIRCKEHIKRIQKELRLLTLETMPFIFSKNPIKLIKRIVAYPIYLFGKNKNHKIRAEKIDNIAKSFTYENCMYAGIVSTGLGIKMKKDTFENLVKVPFESLMLYVPKNYDEYLTKIYGNYMTLPPKKEQHPIHQYKCWWKVDYKSNSEE